MSNGVCVAFDRAVSRAAGEDRLIQLDEFETVGFALEYGYSNRRRVYTSAFPIFYRL